MKSKSIQTGAKNKHANSDDSTNIYRDLGRVVSLTTIKSWIQMLLKIKSNNLSHSPACPRTIRTKANYVEE